jgi:2-polyprenyl-3-methyl-5-hydroxy-6-metoxy-1,4-benzoquinol methylase
MSCLVCKSRDVVPFFNLGNLPLSDYFAASKLASRKAKCFSLIVGRCKSCGLVQNTNIVPAHQRYVANDYSYVSANSKFAINHWLNYCKFVKKILPKDLKSKILDIGSNDGFLVHYLRKLTKSKTVFGLDASPVMVKFAKKKYGNFFYNGLAENSHKIFNNNEFDLVTCNNVLNHSSDPISFLTSIYKLLKKDGKILVEVLDWRHSLKNKIFDQIYHEHTLYFSPKTISILFSKAGFYISKIEKIDYHGGSLRVLAKKSKKIKLYKDDVTLRKCRDLANYSIKRKITAINKIKKIRLPIYLFGAPAKGNTLVNFFGLNYKNIKAALETSETKINKYIPKALIPIINQNNIPNIPFYLINLNWNIPNVFLNFCKKNSCKPLVI